MLQSMANLSGNEVCLKLPPMLLLRVAAGLMTSISLLRRWKHCPQCAFPPHKPGGFFILMPCISKWLPSMAAQVWKIRAEMI
jgi:hypothetical protein